MLNRGGPTATHSRARTTRWRIPFSSFIWAGASRMGKSLQNDLSHPASTGDGLLAQATELSRETRDFTNSSLQTATLATSSRGRDANHQYRKDPPLNPHGSGVFQDETPRERDERKAKERANLDDAPEETFPSSDPVSPFVRAKAQDVATNLKPESDARCAHSACSCKVSADDTNCSDTCRDA